MNKSQEKALEKLREEFDGMVEKENSRLNNDIQIKQFDVRETDEQLKKLIGHGYVYVSISIGKVKFDSVLIPKDYWHITIGPRGGFSTKKRYENLDTKKTKIHGLTECIYKGRYQL